MILVGHCCHFSEQTRIEMKTLFFQDKGTALFQQNRLPFAVERYKKALSLLIDMDKEGDSTLPQELAARFEWVNLRKFWPFCWLETWLQLRLGEVFWRRLTVWCLHWITKFTAMYDLLQKAEVSMPSEPCGVRFENRKLRQGDWALYRSAQNWTRQCEGTLPTRPGSPETTRVRAGQVRPHESPWVGERQQGSEKSPAGSGSQREKGETDVPEDVFLLKLDRRGLAHSLCCAVCPVSLAVLTQDALRC